jgi:hypothetical protein
MTILGKGGPKKINPTENKCFLIGRKLKLAPLISHYSPFGEGAQKINPKQKTSASLLVVSSKMAPLISH